jgi:antitoxin CptB
MTKQDSGCGIQDLGAERGVSHPESRILDPAVLQRLRWRCRRGLLELDIVLGRFVERQYGGLDEAQKVDFDVLLDLPDTTLWDRITGKESAEHETQRKMLELINAA